MHRPPLVVEVADEPGSLPLLSTTLLELWQARDGRTLRLQDYRATGGVRSGVARIAETAYTRLSGDERRVARDLLLRLADVGEGSAERLLVPLAELEGIAGAQPVLAALIDARLLAAGAGTVATDRSEGSTIGHTLISPEAMMATWNVSTGSMVTPTAELGAGTGMAGSDVVAFSGDGKLLAASLLTGGVRVFDPSSGRVLRTLSDPGNDTVSLAFAPKGTLLAAGTQEGTVEMWDPVTGKRLAQPLLADSYAIAGVAFDPSGRRFATTASEDGDVKVWFTASLEQEGPRLAADSGATAAATFEPDGDALLAVDDSGGAFTWPMSLTAWEQRACSVAGRNLTRAEWAQFVAGPHYGSGCR